MSEGAVTCQIRYTLDLNQLSVFEIYARTWIALIERYGGIHHGYFIPTGNPDEMGASFPGMGFNGPTNVAVALFTFSSGEAYRNYRIRVSGDPDCHAMTELVQRTQCFVRYERLFLRPIAP